MVERIQDVAHLGAVELLTPRPDRTLWYFCDLLGMEVVHHDGEAHYLRGYGDHAVATLKISAAKTAGVGCIAWRTQGPEALVRRVAAIEAAGLGLGWTNGDFGRGRSFRFRDPDGHTMEIYYEEERYVAPPELRSTLKNLPQKFAGRGVNVRRIDHLALFCKSVAENRRFAQETLGFRLSERVLFNEGRDEIGSWLSPSPVHHHVAYVADAAPHTGGCIISRSGSTIATT